MRIGAEPADTQSLAHAEPVLLVDHGEAEPGKLHVLLNERLGADHQIDLAGANRGERDPPLAS